MTHSIRKVPAFPNLSAPSIGWHFSANRARPYRQPRPVPPLQHLTGTLSGLSLNSQVTEVDICSSFPLPLSPRIARLAQQTDELVISLDFTQTNTEFLLSSLSSLYLHRVQ